MFKQSSKKVSIVINTSKTSLINVSPKKYSDGKVIIKEILKGNALVMDVSEMDRAEVIRFIDFITGALFAIGGKFDKIATKTYILAPSKDVLDKFISQFK